MCCNLEIKICYTSTMLGIDVCTIYITPLVPPKLLEPIEKSYETKLVFFNTRVINVWASKVATSKCESTFSAFIFIGILSGQAR